MRVVPYTLFCILCAAAGVFTGRYAGVAAPDAAADRSLERLPVSTLSRPPGDKTSGEEKSVLRRAALALHSAGQTRSGRELAALIDASADDEATLRLLADAWLEKDPAAFFAL